jgi:predicted PurR-regulated permease PerM
LTAAAREHYDSARMSSPNRISYAFVILILALTGWFHLGALLLSVLFSYFVITKFDFMKPRAEWMAVTIFILVLGLIGYGLTYFVHEAARSIPRIIDRAVPSIVQWASDHDIELPFTNLQSLKDQAFEFARGQAHNLANFADVARGATREFIYLFIGCVAALGLFLQPRLELDPPSGPARNNLYSLCCEQITARSSTFYRSFSMVMNAQIIISAINTVLTAIFMVAVGLPHLVVALGFTFFCGFVPVLGNLVSNTLVVALGFIISPTKGFLALGYLVVIHKLGYVLNSKIIGAKIQTPVWLLLLALIIGERLMGITGMVLAPVVLHYIRMEASQVAVTQE